MTKFKPMLAVKAKPEKIKYPVFVQAKLDGIRCSIVDGKALTRTLKEVPNREIFNALSRPEFEGLDGELIVGPPTADDCYRTTCSFVMASDKTNAPWRFYVFDRWNRTKSFQNDIWDRAQQVASGWGMIVNISSYDAVDAADLERIEADFVQRGYEGVILRDPNGVYKFGRASVTAGELLKLKRFEDFEATVIGVEEEMHNGNEAVTNALGRTERSTVKANKTGKGTLGALICRGLTDYEGVEFKVGTGFSREQRAEYWAEESDEAWPGTLVGRIAKIKHFPVGAKDKPRFPTFLGFRDEKDM